MPVLHRCCRGKRSASIGKDTAIRSGWSARAAGSGDRTGAEGESAEEEWSTCSEDESAEGEESTGSEGESESD